MEPQTNAGRDFLAGYLACYDVYWGDTEQGKRLDEDDLEDAKFKAVEYENMVHMDPSRNNES